MKTNTLSLRCHLLKDGLILTIGLYLATLPIAFTNQQSPKPAVDALAIDRHVIETTKNPENHPYHLSISSSTVDSIWTQITE